MCKFLLLWLIDILGINSLCRRLNCNRALILWYHGICDDGFDLLKDYDERHITKSSFRKQLEYLKRKGFSFLSMTELVNTIKNRKKLVKKIVLTFDDGFRNVVENAYPIMREFNAKGCFYLVTDLVGTDKLVWTDYVETVIRSRKPGQFHFDFEGEKITYNLTDKKSYEYVMRDIKAKLRSIPDVERIEHLKQFGNINKETIPKEFILASWEEIRELPPDVLEIGSHTRSHPNCANLTSDEELQNEILLSKREIENLIGREVKHFSYPAGSYNGRVIDEVAASGYQSAVSINYGIIDESADLYQLKRIEALPSLLVFKSRISGSYNILKTLGRFF